MAVPKKRTSKRRKKIRRHGHKKAKEAQVKKCQKCGKDTKPHTVCESCGTYNK